MDLMELEAKITVDDSDFKKGVDGAEKAGEQLTKKMSALTVAAGALIADMVKAGFQGIQNMIGNAVNGFADYQQLIGGVETLFKGSADKVAKYAENSFKTTGMSANKYMETVTSFSASLLQGLHGDTEAAADIANMAITDMADNANKMGTDISSIQVAYQGFAKQNYTMLDNLKLGYGGTKEEMVRLINDSGILDKKIKNLDGITFDQLILAIHAIQTEMGITGTTAKEAAETISGSKASLSAAWEDLLAAVGGQGDEENQTAMDKAMENFKTSFSTYMENFIPTLVTTVTNSGGLVTAIANAIAEIPKDAMAKVAEGGLESGTEMIGGVSKVLNWLIDSLTNVFKSASADPSKITEFGKAIGSFIGETLSNIVTSIPDVLQGIVDIGVALAGGLAEGLFKGLFGEGAEVDKITEQLSKDITEVDVNSAKASALVKYIQNLTDKYGAGVTQVEAFKMARIELEETLPGAGEIFTEYGDDVQGAIDKLNDFIEAMRKTSIQAGMTKALEAQYELLGEQKTTKAQAEYAAEMYQAEYEGVKKSIEDSLKAYAVQAAKLYGDNDMVRDEVKAEWARNAQGKISINGQEYGFGEVEVDDLMEAIRGLATFVDDGENSIWNNSYTDNIYSPEELESFTASTVELLNGVADAQAAAEEAQKQIAATEQQIAITEAAVNKTMAESFGKASGSVTTGGTEIEQAMLKVAARISNITFRTGGGSGSASYMPKATGIDYVPFDGFKAELHRGEAVITKSDNARRMDGGASATEVATMLEDAMISAMARVNVLMSGEKVGDLTTRRVERNLNASNVSRIRSMGG